MEVADDLLVDIMMGGGRDALYVVKIGWSVKSRASEIIAEA